MPTWIEDAKGNRCSVEYFGSKEAAQKALDSLKDCKNCTNCSGCSRCSYCSRCSGCSGCSGCSDCSRCSDCSYCSDCSGCSGCSGCSDCSRCSDCSGCSRCSDCSGCSGCSRCSYCSHVARLDNKQNLKGDPSIEPGQYGPPPVPVIENIDLKIYEAASKEGALNMGDVHRCNTTHCRAGWAVHLAGEAGYALERFFNWELAAMKIYAASGSPISPVRFYDSNEDALADMKKRAGVA
jgi:hypothetical protein